MRFHRASGNAPGARRRFSQAPAPLSVSHRRLHMEPQSPFSMGTLSGSPYYQGPAPLCHQEPRPGEAAFPEVSVFACSVYPLYTSPLRYPRWTRPGGMRRGAESSSRLAEAPGCLRPACLSRACARPPGRMALGAAARVPRFPVLRSSRFSPVVWCVDRSCRSAAEDVFYILCSSKSLFILYLLLSPFIFNCKDGILLFL